MATLEMKELNERQKADHLQNQQKLIQKQNKQLEDRNAELEEKFEIITKANLELQKVERELRDELITSIPQDQHNAVKEKLANLVENELQLRLESERLKEIADMAQNQVADLENRKDLQVQQTETLRHQVLDLQSLTDEKALVGRLHQQILALQNKDLTSLQKIKSLQTGFAKLESKLLKSEAKVQASQQQIISARSKFHIKLRSLQKVIQDLRRQYSGSIPLIKQERLSNNLIEINIEKQKLNSLLFQAESKVKSVEKEREEMEVKKRGIDEILKTLKHGSGTKQVLEWHSKLEDLRLKELHARRNAEEWEKEVLQLRDSEKGLKSRNEQLEDELVRMESLMEQRQLEWESREVEMEIFDVQALKEPKEDFNDDTDNILNADIPLSQQLESSLNKGKKLQSEISKLKKQLADSRRGYEELNKKNRDLENQVLGKDRMINDLRLEIPASVDRAVAITSVIGQPGIPSALLPAPDNTQTLSIAQGTIDSLRERLKIKENTIAKYEDMLKDANLAHQDELIKKQKEIIELNEKMRKNQQSYNELRSSRMMEDLTTSDTVSNYVKRTQDLEEEVQDLQESLSNMTAEISAAKNENEVLKKKLESKSNEIEILKEGQSTEILRKQQDARLEIDRLASDIRTYQQENSILKEDLQVMKESQSKAPSTVLKALVERLRNDLADKEKKLKAMGRVINELKNEMINNAEKKIDSADPNRYQNTQSIVDKETKSMQSKIDEQTQLIDKLKRQLKQSKENENKHVADLARMREQLEKKTSVIVKLREDKVSSTGKKSDDNSINVDEKNELKAEIMSLNEKLKRVNQAEKPLEDDKESKVIKNAEEVARWEEKKKWQKKVEELKKKLKEADEEVSKISKQNDGLRETVSRLEREKIQIDNKWKAHLKAGNARTSLNESRLKELQLANSQLKEQLSSLEHKATMDQEPGVETLKLRVKFLQDRIQQQEKKISMLELSKKGGSDALFKEIEALKKKEANCQKIKEKLEESQLELKIRDETSRHSLILLKEELAELSAVLKLAANELANASLVDRLEKCLNQMTKIVVTSDGKKVAGRQLEKTGINLVDQSENVTAGKSSKEDLEMIEKLKESNGKLLEDLEMKERKIAELGILMKEKEARMGKGN